MQVAGYALFINPQWPFVGASPDDFITCDCCPKDGLEIKCPFCHRDESIAAAITSDKNVLLKWMGRLVWIIAMPITIRSRPRYLLVILSIASFMCVLFLRMRNPPYTLKESIETISFGRITV